MLVGQYMGNSDMLCFWGAYAILLLRPPGVAVGLLNRTENRRIVWTQTCMFKPGILLPIAAMSPVAKA